MVTTALFAEQVVIGLQAFVWLVLLALLVFGHGPARAIASILQEWKAASALLGVVAAYSIGVVLDRVYQGMAVALKLREPSRLTNWIVSSENRSSGGQLVAAYREAGILTAYFQYVVGRCRIARATFFNVVLVSVVGSAYVVVRHSPFSSLRSACLFFGSLVGALVFITATLAAYQSLIATLRARAREIQGVAADSDEDQEEHYWA